MKICLVCSHGGHLTEMLQLTEAFEGHQVFFITYRGMNTEGMQNTYLIRRGNIRGMRIPLGFVMGIPSIIKAMLKERPQVVISTGAEIAIPVFYLARLLNIKTIFIESWCRLKKPSGTGKAVYPVTDIFLVQWPQLLGKYGNKAQYWGAVF